MESEQIFFFWFPQEVGWELFLSVLALFFHHACGFVSIRVLLVCVCVWLLKSFFIQKVMYGLVVTRRGREGGVLLGPRVKGKGEEEEGGRPFLVEVVSNFEQSS
ncbi:hypothetical protein QBC35DRAFT_5517 [Podospora australis]|uniref:Transmembrane protein n=1 Tax=Podospora australis TaxID=1536484 RepID=A0AAN6X9G2_9PEZI|nr:hypothetical protein QBC35DRAFT_5517 [Podospora australis]